MVLALGLKLLSNFQVPEEHLVTRGIREPTAAEASPSSVYPSITVLTPACLPRRCPEDFFQDSVTENRFVVNLKYIDRVRLNHQTLKTL